MRAQVRRRFDSRTAGEAMSFPGIDPRFWISYGTVDDDPLAVAVEAGGVFVDVTLQPSGKPLTCRYAGVYSGTLGAVYYPIRPGDEVVVLITNGDENEGPVAMPRMHNDIDAFPLTVNGRPVDGSFPFVKFEQGDWEIDVAGTVRLQDPTGTASLPVARQTDGVQVTPTDSTQNAAWAALISALQGLVGFVAGPVDAAHAAALNAVGAAASAVSGVPISGTITGGSTKLRSG